MSHLAHNAGYWRAKAEDARALADWMRNGEARAHAFRRGHLRPPRSFSRETASHLSGEKSQHSRRARGERSMSFVGREQFEVLGYLRHSIQGMREIAENNHDVFGSRLLLIAEQLAVETANLAAELIEARYLPNAANEP